MSLLNRLIPRGAHEVPSVHGPTAVQAGQTQRLLTESAFVPPPQLGILEDYAGQFRAMQHLTVYACVRLLADAIASLPWHVYRMGKNGVPEKVDPTPTLIKQPYPFFNIFQWKWMVISSLALRGNSYHYVAARDRNGWPTSLMPLHPDMVYVERRDNILEWFNPLYRVMGEAVPASDILHIRRFTMPGEPQGMSPIRQAATAIGLGIAAEEYGYRYFKDSANPSSVLETDQTLAPEDIQMQQKSWISSHGGRRRPAILTGGFKWRPISISPNESQFLETRKFQRSEIAMMMGVPPHMIGDSSTTSNYGTGIEQQSIGFVTYTLRPWLSCFESAISDCLPNGQFVRFGVDELLRGDSKARAEYYKMMRDTGVLNVNEIRREQEFDPIGPEGDIYLQPVNYAPLGFDPANLKTKSNTTAPPGQKNPGNVNAPVEDEGKPNEGGEGDGSPQPSQDSGRAGTPTNGYAIRVP